jgi:hypothetical protein
MAATPPASLLQQRPVFDPRVATKDEFVAKFNQMSRYSDFLNAFPVTHAHSELSKLKNNA